MLRGDRGLSAHNETLDYRGEETGDTLKKYRFQL